MMWRAILLGSMLPVLASCADRGELISLVQRVALVPGVDALDPIDPTPVGQDWRTIQFYLIEPLTAGSVSTFDPAVHLDLDGLPLDPARPPFFNAEAVGGIPPNALLTVTLLPVAEKIPEGTYNIRLLSPEGRRLESTLARFLGEFSFAVSVVAKDGRLPYIVRFRPQQITDVSDETTLEQWFVLNGFGGGVRPHGERVSPHEAIRVEFSERMRTPVPVAGGIPLLTEKFIDTSFGVQRVLLQTIAGIEFSATTESVGWTDSVEGQRLELATVLQSETVEGLEVSADYVLEFPGVAPLASIQGPERDRSGEQLTLRFFADPVAREIPLLDKRGFRTAPIRVNAPDHRSYLNANAFLGGDIVLAAEGEIADFTDSSGSISQVNLTILGPGGGAASTTTVAPFTTNEVNLAGVAIDRYQGTLTFPASGPDGIYELRADAVSAGGSSFGSDTIKLLKDTLAPALFNGTELQGRADETEIIGLCVVASSDTVSAELLFGTTSLGTSTAFAEVLVTSPFGVFRRFCFDPFPRLAAFRGGINLLSVKLTDEAGNEVLLTDAFTVRLQPVIKSITPQPAEPGDLVFVRGFGLKGITAGDSIEINGDVINLGHGFRGADPPATLGSIFAFSGLGGPEVLAIRTPDFMSSGSLRVRLADGTVSTSAELEICLPPISPFVADELQDQTTLIDNVTFVPAAGFVAGVTLSRMTTVFRAVGGTFEPIRSPAGQPIAAYLDRDPSVTADRLMRRLRVATWSGAAWDVLTINTLPEDSSYLRAVAVETSPIGETGLVSIARTPTTTSLRFARRGPAICEFSFCGSAPRWTDVEILQMPTIDTSSPESLALTFAQDGRAAIAFVGANNQGVATLYTAVEVSANSNLFSVKVLAESTALDPSGDIEGTLIPGSGLSATFDNQGRLYVAFGSAFHRVPGYVVDDTPEFFSIRVVRLEAGTGALTQLPPLGIGLSPSVSINPLNGFPTVAFQRLDAFHNTGNPPYSIVSGGDVLFATYDGFEWRSEVVERRTPMFAFQVGGPGVYTFDPASSIAKTKLEHSRSGKARVIYTRPLASVILATRQAENVWDTPVAALSHHVSGGLDLELDGLGNAVAIYDHVGIRDESVIRLFREDDARAIDASLDSTACSDDFKRSTTVPDISSFIAAHDSHPYSVEWLTAVPDLANLQNNPPDPATAEHARHLLVTALEGFGVTEFGFPAASVYRLRSTGNITSFTLSIRQLRGSGQRELVFLAGDVAYNVAANPPTPIGAVLFGRLRANANTFRIVPGILLTDVTCQDPSGTALPALDCGLTAADVAALRAEPFQLIALAVGLALAPAADTLDEGEIDVHSLSLRLRRLSVSTEPSIGSSGSFGLDVEIPEFDIDVDFSAESVCTTTPISVSIDQNQLLRLSGPLLTTSRVLPGGTDPLRGQPKVLLNGAFVPLPDIDPGGNATCKFLAETFFGSAFGGDVLGSRLVGRQASRVLRAVLVEPALDAALTPVVANDAWSLYISPSGRVEAITPP